MLEYGLQARALPRCRRWLLLLATLVAAPEPVPAQVEANVSVIVEKLPLDRQAKMRRFHETIKRYIETADWFAEREAVPVSVSLQLFLTDSPSNLEERYNCEFLISSSDVQYFDKRMRFPYQEGDQLTYNEQTIDALTGVIDFYINMVLGNELDKYEGFGGDFYYKRALNIANLGKFVRKEFVSGWTNWREPLIKRVFTEPFITFRKMKDYYFYGLYILGDNMAEARKNVRIAFDLMETVMEKRKMMDEPQQFLDAHYHEFIDLFKDVEAKERKTVFEKLILIDPGHKDSYEEYLPG